MKDVTITPFNEVKCQVAFSSSEVKKTVREWFSFYVDGYQFTPKYKQGFWDGKISFFDKDGLFYSGLIKSLVKKCKENNLSIQVNDIDRFKPDTNVSLDTVEPFSKMVRFTPYDYQKESVLKSLRLKKLLILSATSSGKSCVIYMLYRYCIENDLKLLITVPNISLVEQLFSDFKDYVSDDHNVDDYVAMWHSKTSKERKQVIISTWQTLSKQKDILHEFDFYICDEAHSAKAEEITNIIDGLENCKYRIGLTGTLNGSVMHEIDMIARFGDIHKSVTARELIDMGLISDIRIHIQRLKYTESERKTYKGIIGNKKTSQSYQREIDYILTNENRNKYVIELALNLPNNTIMLFNRVDAHADILYDKVKAVAKNHFKNVFFISGKINPKEREYIRKKMDDELPKFYIVKNGDEKVIFDENEWESEKSKYNDFEEVIGSNILMGTYGTISTGINIKQLHNLIFCHPLKSKITTLQSIGRILRKANGKSMVHLYDLADDFRLKSNSAFNYSLKHSSDRIEIYDEQEFEYEISELDLSNYNFDFLLNRE